MKKIIDFLNSEDYKANAKERFEHIQINKNSFIAKNRVDENTLLINKLNENKDVFIILLDASGLTIETFKTSVADATQRLLIWRENIADFIQNNYPVFISEICFGDQIFLLIPKSSYTESNAWDIAEKCKIAGSIQLESKAFVQDCSNLIPELAYKTIKRNFNKIRYQLYKLAPILEADNEL